MQPPTKIHSKKHVPGTCGQCVPHSRRLNPHKLARRSSVPAMEPEETSKHQRHHRISAVSIFNGEIDRAASAQIEEVAMCHSVPLHFPDKPFPGRLVPTCKGLHPC